MARNYPCRKCITYFLKIALGNSMFNRLVFLSLIGFLHFGILFGTHSNEAEKKLKIGLCLVATGKYIRFVEPLIESAQKYFCTKHDVYYFVFTDGQVKESDRIIKLFEKRLGWPYDTMMRYVMYDKHSDTLKSMDYLYACDSDMRFIGEIGDEILSERVAVLSPGYIGTKGTPETRAASTACIRSNEGKYYFAGGLVGGTSSEFLKLAHTVTNNIMTDLNNGIVAVWHDESHINRYFIDHEPTLILNELYCYPECWRERHPNRWDKDITRVKLLNINKDLDEMRK